MRDLRVPRENAPRKSAAWQIWYREHRQEVIDAAGPRARIGERNRTAAELYRKQDDKVKEAMEAITEQEHKAAMEIHNDTKTGLPSTDLAERMK